MAFRFASSLDASPVDKTRAQAAVAIDFATIGSLDRAMTLADQVEGWRQGIALADVAGALAKAGRDDDAKAMLEKARRFRAQLDGWQGPRVEAHIAEAMALIGQPVESRELAERVAENDTRQYGGRAAATAAAALSSEGDFQGAMDALADLEHNDDLEISRWRTSGYLSIAESHRLDAAQRRTALAAARASADRIPGFSRVEALTTIAGLYRELGDADGARAAADAAAEFVLGMPEAPSRSALMATVARSFGELGIEQTARSLLRQAEGAIGSAMKIERPELFAYLAGSYLVIDDREAAARLYDRALSVTESLTNARPRALAALAICRSLGLLDVAPERPVQSRLDALYAGLGDPW